MDSWIFGYGSLMWQPAFPYEERRKATLEGWVRRFWQGSIDHRGVPDAPGRVVTLIRDPGGECRGIAYRVTTESLPRVLERLDIREQGGYDRHVVELQLDGGLSAESVLYVANDANPNFLGPARVSEIADQIRRSHGPSGSNLDYLLRLHEALTQMGVVDLHVHELVSELATVR